MMSEKLRKEGFRKEGVVSIVKCYEKSPVRVKKNPLILATRSPSMTSTGGILTERRGD